MWDNLIHETETGTHNGSLRFVQTFISESFITFMGIAFKVSIKFK